MKWGYCTVLVTATMSHEKIYSNEIRFAIYGVILPREVYWSKKIEGECCFHLLCYTYITFSLCLSYRLQGLF